MTILQWLDRWAARVPPVADFLYTVWRPRPAQTWRLPLPACEGGFVVQPDDVVYPHKMRGEAFYWGIADFRGTIIQPRPTGTRMANRAHTGDPARSWLDDLIARGPFRDVAVLGCDEEQYEAAWLRQGGSQRLDIYELSPLVIRKVRAGLGPLRRRARFIRADLNFVRLPPERYDLIWSSGCLHHIVNLEHLFRHVARALRPGGLFALHDYVGERRMQYAPQRLARANAVLHDVPVRFRFGGITEITAPEPATLSPFCAVRSDDVLTRAEPDEAGGWSRRPAEGDATDCAAARAIGCCAVRWSTRFSQSWPPMSDGRVINSSVHSYPLYASQRRDGGDVAAIGRALEDAFDGVVEGAAELFNEVGCSPNV